MPTPRRSIEHRHHHSVLRDFLEALGDGEYDNDLIEIWDALEDRRDAMKDKLHTLVKQVFGLDARIVLDTPENPFVDEPPRTKSNPFVEKKEEPLTDALSNPEQKLNEGESPAIESRGAIIGGISSSDISGH